MSVAAKNHMFFSKVLEEVKKLPASTILSKYIKVHRNAHSDDDGLCPFHGDTAFGNFKINDKKGIYKCFTCGAYGDGIQFVRDLMNVPFKSAVLKIAVDQGIINESQADEFSGGSVRDIIIQQVAANLTVKEKPNGITEIATSAGRHIAYSIFLKGVSLSDEHRNYLRQRGLTDDEINEKGFFTFPEPTEEFLDALHQRVRRYGLTYNVFKKVPGFHTRPSLALESIHERTGEREYRYTFAKHKGIGIPVKDTRGQIIGIQIRKDRAGEKKKRYTWFSSSYASYEDNDFIFGTPAGAPTHVAIPKENRYPGVVFITEGFFKAEEVAKTFGVVCISVSGVGNYRTIREDLHDIEKYRQMNISHVYISYDADMCQNIQVYQHAKNMAALIKEEFPEVELYMSLWREQDGKGIDDLIQNRKMNTLRKVDFDQFASLYDEMVSQLEKKYEKIQRIPKEVVEKNFYHQVFPKVYSSSA